MRDRMVGRGPSKKRYTGDEFRVDEDTTYAIAGTAVVAFTLAASLRVYDQATGQWQDGDMLFLRCSAWRELADHAAESLSKGMRVIVTGRLKQRSYETTRACGSHASPAPARPRARIGRRSALVTASQKGS